MGNVPFHIIRYELRLNRKRGYDSANNKEANDCNSATGKHPLHLSFATDPLELKLKCDASCPRICQKIDPREFKLYESLGVGAYGEVRVAIHQETKKAYALKSLQKSKVVVSRHVKHVNNERDVLSMVNFPFIVKLLFTCQDASRVYLAMEYVEGGDMFGMLRVKRKFSENATRFYGAQIALTLEYLHNLDIIYRDLKPENILLDNTGYLKLTDFGFAKVVTKRTYTLCGTPDYMAPEVIIQKGYGRSADWWSFGVLLYEMSTGYSPFEGIHPVQVYDNILTAKFSFPVTTMVSHQLKNLIRSLLQKDPVKRLACSTRYGGSAVRQHCWFASMDWMALLRKEIQPPYKLQPPIPAGKIAMEKPYDIPALDEHSKLFPNF